MMRTRGHTLLSLLVVLSGLVAVAGCEERVTAVVGTDLPYSLYGLLTPDLPAQKVLVYPVEGTLRPRGADPLDAVVESTDLTTGETRRWRDSLVVDSLGLNEHVFRSDFRAKRGHAYRITVTRTDGASSTVETAVPPPTTIRTDDPTVFPGVVTLPAIVEGGAPRILKPVVVYFVTFRVLNDMPDQAAVEVDYDGRQEKDGEEWVVPIDLAADYDQVERAVTAREFAALDRTFGIRIDQIRLQLIVASEEWSPPGGTFDPEVIVQPGTMSNVENGYGFVAAGYRHDWRLDLPAPDVLGAAGFVDASR